MRYGFFLIVAVFLVGAGCGGDQVVNEPDAGGTPSSFDVPASVDRPVPDGGVSFDLFSGDALPDGASPEDLACPAESARCGAQCVDLSTDPIHCGHCDIDCQSLPWVDRAAVRCEAGRCVFAEHCRLGRGDCDGTVGNGCETDLTTATTCGRCGTVCPESRPFCTALPPGDGGAGYSCSSGCSGMTPDRCGSTCVSTASDPAHCGGCGRVCALPHAEAACEGGSCRIGRCAAGFADCDGDGANGCEVDLSTDPAHCGRCGEVCPSAVNATPVCVVGRCDTTCSAGAHRCGSVCASNSATSSCGSSCLPCPTIPNGRATCDGRLCGIECDEGFHSCGDACVPSNDPNTCGARCEACPAGPVGSRPVCTTALACDFVCTEGYHRCGALCRANTSTFGCGTSCTPCPVPANATATCDASTGACGMECLPDRADCDGDPSTGCEVSTLSLTDCGGCGRRCPVATAPHTVASCSRSGGSAACGLACATGWVDCDGDLTNGCEAFGTCTTSELLFYEPFDATPFARWALDQNWMRSSRASGIVPYDGAGNLLARSISSGPCAQSGYATLVHDIDTTRVVGALQLSFATIAYRGPSDGYAIEASTNHGATWSPVDAFLLLSPSSWSVRTVDLSSFVGSPSLRLRFYYLDACDGQNFVWHIDAVSVRASVRNY